MDFDEGGGEIFEEIFAAIAPAELVLETVGKHINHIALLDANYLSLKVFLLPHITAHRHCVALQTDGVVAPDNQRRLIGDGITDFHLLKIKRTDSHIHTVVEGAAAAFYERRFDECPHTVEHRAGIFGVLFRHHILPKSRNTKHREQRARNTVPRAVGGNHHRIPAATQGAVIIAAHNVAWTV